MDDALGPVRGIGQALAATVQGHTATGEGESFRLRPRWPSVAQLEYVQKFATSSLLVVGLLLLVGYALKNPRGAVGAIAQAGKAKIGAA